MWNHRNIWAKTTCCPQIPQEQRIQETSCVASFQSRHRWSRYPRPSAGSSWETNWCRSCLGWDGSVHPQLNKTNTRYPSEKRRKTHYFRFNTMVFEGPLKASMLRGVQGWLHLFPSSHLVVGRDIAERSRPEQGQKQLQPWRQPTEDEWKCRPRCGLAASEFAKMRDMLFKPPGGAVSLAVL